MLEISRSSSSSNASVDKGSPAGSKPVCEVCGSTNVSDAICIEHLPCGYIASIATFEFNNFVCPRCGRKLVKENVDYRRIILRVCHDCGHIGRVKEVTLSKKAEESVHADRALQKNLSSWMAYVEDVLTKLGLRYVRDYRVRGLSGAVHRWDFAVWLSEGERPDILIELKSMNLSKPFLKPLDNIFDILSIAIKKADSGIKHLILIMNYEGADNLLKTCEELDIKLVSATHKELFAETLKHLVRRLHRAGPPSKRS